MASPTKIQKFPSATTVERDALPAIPNGSSLYNSDDSRIEYTIDGGSTWSQVATVADVYSVTLQTAYDDGDGTITTTAAKPVVIDTTLAGFQLSGLTISSLVTSDVSNNLVTGNLSGDLTTSGLVSTLATVNNNVGTYGDSGNVSQITVNEKGLITAATNVAIDFTSIDLQEAYNNGDGSIITAAAKPVFIDTKLSGFQLSGLSNSSLVTSDNFNNLVSGDLTGDVTTSLGLATTLATVATGATVGDATNIPQFTFNNKGLVTSATEIAVDFSSVDLQQAYNNSGTPAKIILNGGKPIQVRNAADDAGWEVDTNADRSFQTFTSSNGFPNFIKSEQTLTPTLAGETILQIDNEGKNTVGSVSNYACFLTLQSNVTPGQEAGEARFNVLDDNVVKQYLILDGETQSVQSLNFTSKTLDFTATLDDITLQNTYDISLPTPAIVQDDINHTRIENSFNTCGVEFETGINNINLQVYGNAFENMILDFHNTNGFPSPGPFGKIIGSSFSSGAYFDIEWTVADATASAEDVDVSFRATSNGSSTPYMYYTGSLDRLQVINDTSKALDTVATLDDITLQNAYTNGDGSISLAAGKPFEIIGINDTDPAEIELYTTTNTAGHTIAFLDFDGNNSLGSRVSYGEIDVTIEDPQAGDHSGKMEIKVSSDDFLQNFIVLDGGPAEVTIAKPLKLTFPNVEFDGNVVGPGYAPCITMRVRADGAIQVGAPLKASSTTDFSVVTVTASDDLDVPIIGFATTAAVLAGDVIGICGASIIEVQSDSTGGVTRNDAIDKSQTDDGRVKTATGTSGHFGVAAQSVAANTFFKCWVIKNDNIT